jgi:hypothetical protein
MNKTTIISRRRRIQFSIQPTETLRNLLTERHGYWTFVATLGTNGNGGALSCISDIVNADLDDQHLDNYELASFEYPELRDHVADAGGELCDGDEWAAFDYHHEDDQGYLTGSISRIYVNLAI